MVEPTATKSYRPRDVAVDERAHVWVVIHLAGRLRPYPLPVGGDWVIGRDEGVDLPLPDRFVSRQHLRLERTSGGVFVTDLGSANGTLINGREVEGRSHLVSGDEVEVGGSAFWLHVSSDSSEVPESLPGHDDFLDAAAREMARASVLERPLGLILLEAQSGSEAFMSRSVPRLRAALRDEDRVALYSPRLVEALLTSAATRADLEARGRELLEEAGSEEPPLRVAVVHVPRGGATPDAVLQAGMKALRELAFGPDAFVGFELGLRTSAEEGHLELFAASDSMKRLLERIVDVSVSEANVLVRGPTGAGKELVARSILARGRRRGGPFVAVNCAAIPRQLFEATMFGHEAGAFTGADGAAEGVFRAAAGGTLFLDEVGELSPDAQAALLRCVETKRVLPVGATQEVDVDVQVIAATHRDLLQLVKAGLFRQDLYYRLATIELRVPPLRERIADILPLARHFLMQVCQTSGLAVMDFDESAIALLLKHSWPGNVRELRNVVEHAALNAHGDTIGPHHLSSRLSGGDGEPAEPTDSPCFRSMVEEFERTMLLQALRRAQWNRTEVSRRLGIPLRTLTNKVKRYGLSPDEG